MAQYFQVHPTHPQARLIRQAVEIVRRGGVIVYPTDSSYALGCAIGNKEAQERIRAIRSLEPQHNFTLVCSDLSQLALYALVDNANYRLLKAYTPGPYTFLLPATREVPRRLQNPKRRTIGLRVPDHPVAQALLAELREPLMSVSLILSAEATAAEAALPLSDPAEIRARLEHQVDLVLDGGSCGMEPTTVVDLDGPHPRLVRAGKGDIAPFVTAAELNAG